MKKRGFTEEIYLHAVKVYTSACRTFTRAGIRRDRFVIMCTLPCLKIDN